MYAISDEQQQHIDLVFHHRTPKGEPADRCEMLAGQARMFALTLAAACPPGRELDMALGKLQECMMWAAAAIARNP